MALAGYFGDNYKTVLWKRKDAMTGFFQEVSDYCGVTEVTATYMPTRYVCGYLGYLGKISYCVCVQVIMECDCMCAGDREGPRNKYTNQTQEDLYTCAWEQKTQTRARTHMHVLSLSHTHIH